MTRRDTRNVATRGSNSDLIDHSACAYWHSLSPISLVVQVVLVSYFCIHKQLKKLLLMCVYMSICRFRRFQIIYEATRQYMHVYILCGCKSMPTEHIIFTNWNQLQLSEKFGNSSWAWYRAKDRYRYQYCCIPNSVYSIFKFISLLSNIKHYILDNQSRPFITWVSQCTTT